MSVLILIAVLAVAFFAVGYGAQRLFEFVRGDGSTEQSWTRTPPRSHHLDQFDPRSRPA